MEANAGKLQKIVALLLCKVYCAFPKGRIWVSGSLASNEMTFFKKDEICFMSDLDVILFVDIPLFLRNFLLKLSENFSKKLTESLNSKGIRTHISVNLISPKISKFITFLQPNSVYLYEMRPIKMSTYGFDILSYHVNIKPAKIDCLNLIFSALADYIFVKFNLANDFPIYEKIYIVAKRYCTLIYSLLLFNGICPRGYMSTLENAKKHFNSLHGILSQYDIEILEMSTKYKVSGNLYLPVKTSSFKLRDETELLSFLSINFEKLAKKILLYELSEFFGNNGSNLCKSDKCNFHVLNDLLKKYYSTTKMSIGESLLRFIFNVVSFIINKNNEKLRLEMHLLLKKRHKMCDFLRYQVCKLFLLTTPQTVVCENLKQYISIIKKQWDLFMM